MYSKIPHPFLFLFSFCAMLLLASCYTPRYSYSPSAQNIPVLVEKGDSKTAISYSTNMGGGNRTQTLHRNGYSNGFDAQGAYAITNHLAVQVSYFNRSERNGGYTSDNGDSTVIRYKRNLSEFGVGYFTKLTSNGSIAFQGFAGMGFGKFNFTDVGLDNNVSYTNYHRADIRKIYIQPALMFLHKKRMAFSISSRFSYITYNNIQTDYSQAQLKDYKLNSLGKKTVRFFEPAFTHAFGLKKFPFMRIEYQFGFSDQLSSTELDTRGVNFSIGFQADINQLLKRKPW